MTPVHYRLLVQIFELDGFSVVRHKGDHIVMTKPGIRRPVVIKTSPRMAPITHIRTNMRTANISRERFFELLNQVT